MLSFKISIQRKSELTKRFFLLHKRILNRRRSHFDYFFLFRQTRVSINWRHLVAWKNSGWNERTFLKKIQIVDFVKNTKPWLSIEYFSKLCEHLRDAAAGQKKIKKKKREIDYNWKGSSRGLREKEWTYLLLGISL